MRFRIQVFASAEAFAVLRPSWNALAERSVGTTVFSSWEWQSSWWKHYAPNSRLIVLSAWDSDRLAGLLPMYVRRRILNGLLPMRELLLVGSGGDTSPDYLGAILEPESAAEVAPLLAADVIRSRDHWDVLNFTDVAPGPFADAMQAALTGSRLECEQVPCSTIKVVHAPASWEEYLAGMHRDRRYRVRHQRNKLLKELGAQLLVARSDAEIAASVEALVDLHRKRWDSKGSGQGAFRTAEYLRFHREVIELCHRNDWVRLYSIAAAGRTIAVFYCYRYRNELLYFQSGFDPEFERYSLGAVLMGFAIESAIAEGLQVIDLLKGDHAYKNSWSNGERLTVDIHAHNRSTLGRMHWLRSRLKRSLLHARARAGTEQELA